jgi:hypothetical protein
MGSVVVLIVLIVLTVKSIGGGDGSPAAASDTSSSGAVGPGGSSSTVTRPSTSGSHSSSVPARSSSSPARQSPSSAHSSAPVKAADCTAAQMKVAAVVEHSTYAVGAQPVVMLQATNTGAAPCIQNLGGRNVELQIYNGESRVWGSNDCAVDPTPVERTFAVNKAVRVSITWSGLTSQKKCAGTRQRVGAGTYTLYPYLMGHRGTAAQFAIH